MCYPVWISIFYYYFYGKFHLWTHIDHQVWFLCLIVFYRNSEKILKLLKTGNLSQDMIPHHINFSSITAEDYNLVYDIIQKVKEEEFESLGLKSCQIEDELGKVREINTS